jgi:hypothetical protein
MQERSMIGKAASRPFAVTGELDLAELKADQTRASSLTNALSGAGRLRRETPVYATVRIRMLCSLDERFLTRISAQLVRRNIEWPSHS